MLYVELFCSLPHLENPFDRKRPPITAVQFRKRMNMLDYEAKAIIERLSNTFYWGRIDMEESDAQLVKAATKLLDELELSDIRRWQMWRMDVRTLMAALRRRAQGKPAPEPGNVWGYGHYAKLIQSHWEHPTFKMEGRFPWLNEALNLIEAQNVLGLERHLLGVAWDYYSRQQANEQYSLSDIWLYAMKWDVVDRWCLYNADNASKRFDQLIESGLSECMNELKAMQ